MIYEPEPDMGEYKTVAVDEDEELKQLEAELRINMDDDIFKGKDE